jgi:tetratricopeptide (TPR) repeat protein
MFFAPISEVVTKIALHLRWQMPKPVTARRIAAGLLVLVLFVAPAAGRRAFAQDAPPQFDDLASRAAAARDQQNIPLAIELYGKAEQAKPDWAEGWWYLGLLQYSSNNFSGAIEAFNHLLQLEPKAVPAMALRGLCEFETASYDDSLRDLEEAVAHGAANEPRNAQIIRFHLAQLLTRAGRFQDAVTQFGFFAAQHVVDPDLLVALGLAGMRVPSLTRDIAPEDRALYQSAGAAGYAFLNGDTEEADGFFNALFAHYPSTPNLHYFYGFLLFPHSPELSIIQFQDEIAVAPSNEPAHALLGFTLMIAGRYAEALPEAERALAAAPGMEMAQLALGRSLAETGDLHRGAELLNKVLARDPDNLEAHMGLAAIYSRTGRREDAYRERQICLGLAK